MRADRLLDNAQDIQPDGFCIDHISAGILDLAAVVVAAVAGLGGEGKGCLLGIFGDAVLPGLAVGRNLPLIGLAGAGSGDRELGGFSCFYLRRLGLGKHAQDVQPDSFGVYRVALGVGDLAAVIVAAVAGLGGKGEGCLLGIFGDAVLPCLAVRGALPLVLQIRTGSLNGKLNGVARLFLLGLGLGGNRYRTCSLYSGGVGSKSLHRALQAHRHNGNQ